MTYKQLRQTITPGVPSPFVYMQHISSRYLENRIGEIRDAYFFILGYVRGFLQCPQLYSHLKAHDESGDS